MNNYFAGLILCFLVSSCTAGQKSNERLMTGENHAKKQIQQALKDSTVQPFYDTLIKDKETAIAIVEPILFKIYGKKQIIKERPYETYLIDGYWYITGSLPKGHVGGTFEIIFGATDGKIIKLTHYK